MAEWSKALALGASPKGRGFEPHRYQILFPFYLLYYLINSIDLILERQYNLILDYYFLIKIENN